MFTESIHALANYNIWSNEKITQKLETLTEEQFHADITSSFPSIIKTVAHVHGAEDIWRQRLDKIHPTVFYRLPENVSGIVELNKWMDASRAFAELILSYDDTQLNETIHYVNSRGEDFAATRWQMIQHAVNHSSYHRGQLITMMRQVGETIIPNTDLINYYRSVDAAVK